MTRSETNTSASKIPLNISSLWNEFIQKYSKLLLEDSFDNFFYLSLFLKELKEELKLDGTKTPTIPQESEHATEAEAKVAPKQNNNPLNKETLLHIFNLIHSLKEVIYMQAFKEGRITYKGSSSPIPPFLTPQHFTESSFLNFIYEIKKEVEEEEEYRKDSLNHKEYTILSNELKAIPTLSKEELEQRLYNLLYQVSISYLQHQGLKTLTKDPEKLKAEILSMLDEYFHFHKRRVLEKEVLKTIEEKVFRELWLGIMHEKIILNPNPFKDTSSLQDTLGKYYLSVDSGLIEEINEGEIIIFFSKKEFSETKDINFKYAIHRERNRIRYKRLDEVLKDEHTYFKWQKRAKHLIDTILPQEFKISFKLSNYLMPGICIYHPAISSYYNEYEPVYYEKGEWKQIDGGTGGRIKPENHQVNI